MSALVQFRAFEPGDIDRFELQPSQRFALGLHHHPSAEEARDLAARGAAWTGIARDGRVLGCAGFLETFPGRQGVAWAMLAAGLGAAHLAITRFVRARLADSPLDRIEAIVRAEGDAERRWAVAVGFDLVAVLRKFGPLGETHLLFERVR